MKFETKFNLGDLVKVKSASIAGTITALRIYCDGTKTNIFYVLDGAKNDDFADEHHELDLIKIKIEE